MPSAPSPTSPPRSWNVFIAGALLVLATFAAYHNSFSGPLIYDDIPAIRDNPTIRQLWPLSTVLSPPNDSGITVNGRPLVNLSLAINYAMGGTEVFGYHVFNFIVHTCAGLALFGFVRRTLNLPALRARFATGDEATLWGFVVAVLWTMHPLQTESVTYIIQRAESLVGLFYLLTFYCFVRSVTEPNPTRWRVLTVGCCLLGMTSKEVMASAPLLILLYDRAVVSGTFREAWQRHKKLYLCLAATWILLGWLVIGTGSRGGTAGFGAGGVSSWHYLLTSALAIGIYLKLVFWPVNLVFDYGTDVEKHLLPVLPQSLILVGFVLATAYALWRKPLLGFIGLWFFAILGPSSSIIPVATETMAEHRMYLPLVSIIALVVLASAPFIGRKGALVFLLLAVAFGSRTVIRNEDYQDELRLWRDTQQRYPTNARGHNNVGEILYRQEKFDEAIACFREAVRLLPNYIDAINNLGNSLTQQGRAAEALPYVELALLLKPGYHETHNNLGNALYQLGRKEEAITNYRQAVLIKPTFPDPYNNLGVVLADLGNYGDAIKSYESALRLKPAYIDAHYNYGNALSLSGRTADAIAQFNETLRLKPTHAESHNNLGSILYQQGKIAEAKSHYELAIRHKADYPDALNNLGVALCQTGKPAEALPYFALAVRLKPDYNAARGNLSDVLNMLGAEAIKDGKLGEARKRFEESVSANPTNAGAHNNLAVVLWRQGLLHEALGRFEEAIKLKPDYKEAVSSATELRGQLANSSSDHAPR